MSEFRITHSCGHALTTPGKRSPDGYKEWSYTNAIVKIIMTELDKYEGVKQKRIDDTTGRTDYPLTVRTDMSDSFNPTLHIDYHMNAYGTGWSSPGGTETFVYKKTLSKAVSIATKIQNNLAASLGFPNRGVKEGDLHMIRETNATAILIEFAFMTNKNEATLMRTAEYQRKAALAVVNGLVKEYGLRLKKVEGESDMPKKAVVIFGEADYATGKRLAEKLGSTVGVYTRNQASAAVVAETIYVVGGTKDGLKGTNFVVLSGPDYFSTVKAVGEYVK